MLVLNGLELQDPAGRWHFDVDQGADDMPAMRGESSVVPFRRGRLDPDLQPDRRRLILPGYIATASLRSAIDDLKKALAPVGGLLTWGDPSGSGAVRWTTVTALNVLATAHAPSARLYSIELEADPFWYSTHAVVTITPTTTDFAHVLDASGTADVTKVRVEVDGVSTGIVTVKNDVLNVGFTHPTLAAAPDRLIVDSGARTALLNGFTARANLVLLTANKHGEYIRLSPGTNTIRVTGQPAAVRLYFDSVWL